MDDSEESNTFIFLPFPFGLNFSNILLLVVLLSSL
jgi:hypothetical protein